MDANDPSPPEAAAADDGQQLPPMPEAAPPIPPPVAFDPLASSSSADEAPTDVAGLAAAAAAAPLSTASSDQWTETNNVATSSTGGGDADLLGTGLDVSVAAPAAEPAPAPPQPAWSNADPSADDDGAGESSEYETDDDDDDDDDMIVGFPSRTYSSDDGGNEDNNLLGTYDGAAAAADLQAHQKQPNPEIDEYVEPTDDLLRPGDHVYSWVQKKQRHGIVLSVGDGVLTEADPNDCDRDAVTIVYFYTRENRDRRAEDGADDAADVGYASLATGDVGEINDDSLLGGGDGDRNGDGANGGGEANNSIPTSAYAANATAISLATFCGGSTKKNAVRKVRYGSNFAKRLLSRPGSVTAVQADVPGLVLARVKFLLDSPGVLPPYHRMAANGECAAVWCRIGRFITLQGSSILQIMFFGQAGGAVAGGVVASNVMLWSPMPGLWGTVGWWWYVPATVAYPFLIPLLVGFGLASLLPLEILRRFRSKWKKHTQDLNREFWTVADEETKVEFFGTTATADEDWVRKFFGGKDEEQDKAEHGEYMPVGEGGGDDDDVDDELERKWSQNMASAYNAEFGGLDDDNKLHEKQNGLLQQWKRSFGKNRNMSQSELHGDDAVPLSNNGLAGGGNSATASQQQRPSLMAKWRDSWANRGSGSGELAERQGTQLGSVNYRYHDDDDEEIPANRGLMS